MVAEELRAFLAKSNAQGPIGALIWNADLYKSRYRKEGRKERIKKSDNDALENSPRVLHYLDREPV